MIPEKFRYFRNYDYDRGKYHKCKITGSKLTKEGEFLYWSSLEQPSSGGIHFRNFLKLYLETHELNEKEIESLLLLFG